MKILFFGNSITDMGRNRTRTRDAFDYGVGYVFNIAGELLSRRDNNYEIVNRGVSGDNIVRLYARVQEYVWAENPDVLTILIGINDVWHNLDGTNMGVDADRFKKVYRILLEETSEKLPGTKIILMEPFVLKGWATEEKYGEFLKVKDYAKVVEKLSTEFKVMFLPLQKAFDEAIVGNEVENYLADGVHPNAAGAKLIADEWLRMFDRNVVKAN